MRSYTFQILDGSDASHTQVYILQDIDEALKTAVRHFAEFMNWSSGRFRWGDDWSLECRGHGDVLLFKLHFTSA
jgi:hypothetical protein